MGDVPRVVLGVNGSTASRRAILRAAALFPDAQLVAAVVIPGDPARAAAPDGADLTPWPVPFGQGAAASGRLEAAALAIGEVCDVLGPRARPVLLHGEPAGALGRLAQAERADVIVVGSLRRSGRRRVLSSMADELVAIAPCPVLELGAC